MKRKKTKKIKENAAEKAFIEQQAARIEELREENRRLSEIISDYRAREKEIASALEFARKKGEEYVALAKVKYAFECDRITKFKTKLEKFRSKEELVRGYDNGYKELKEWRDELERAIAGDFGSAMRDYVDEKERLSDEHVPDYGAIADSVKSDLTKVSQITEYELKELLEQI